MCLVGVVVRRYIYRFPHNYYLSLYTPLVSAFLQQHPYFIYFIFYFMFFVLVPVHFCNLFNNFSHSIKKHKSDYRRHTEAV